MKNRTLSFLIFCLLAAAPLWSQVTNNFQQPTSINGNGVVPDASAMLDVQSTTKGMLVPRLTTAQRTAIATPANGLLVFDTDTGGFWYYENSDWNELATTPPPSESGENTDGGNIPDNDPMGLTSIITLADPDTVATGTRFRVCLDITHPSTDHLDISLEAPDGTFIILSFDNGGTGDNFTGTCFSTEATNPISNGDAPFTGNWKPEEPFSVFIGKTIAGPWKLKVVDDASSQTGQLNHWSILLSPPYDVAVLIADADGDTRVTVEELPDEDVVRLEAGGNSNRLEIRPDSSVFSSRLRILGNLVSGNQSNTALGLFSTVSGGFSNAVPGAFSFIGGGGDNNIMENNSFIGGGNNNLITQRHSFIGGGGSNQVSAKHSFIGGGVLNAVSGENAFAGGGEKLLVKSYAEAVFGTFNTDYAPQSTTAINAADRLFVIGNGTSTSARSNAVTVMKNGNVGIGTDSPDAMVHLEGGALLAQGTTGATPVSGAGTRLMWIPEQSAFRAGYVLGDQWDDTNIGFRSFVGGGVNNMASGFNSFIGSGFGNIASGEGSFIGGGEQNKTTTTGHQSFIGGGEGNEASGSESFIGGGLSNKASNTHSFVGGGYFNQAAGFNSFVGGSTSSNASGSHSFIGGGENLYAKSYGETVFGTFNTDYTPQSTSAINAADRLFVIGNGTSFSARSNAVTVMKNGKVGIGTDTPDAILHTEINAAKNASFANRTGLFLDNVANDGTYPLNPNSVGIAFGENGVAKQAIVGATYANDYLRFYTGSSFAAAKMTLTNDGLGIGTEFPSQKLHVMGNICYTGSIGACSDARFKKDFTHIGGALGKVRQLKGLYYFWKKEEFPEKQFGDKRQIGLIAQEVEALFPEMVLTDAEGYKSVDYSRLTPVLVEAVKEQQEIIENGKWRMENLEKEVAVLQAQLAEMADLKNRMAQIEAALLQSVSTENGKTQQAIGK